MSSVITPVVSLLTRLVKPSVIVRSASSLPMTVSPPITDVGIAHRAQRVDAGVEDLCLEISIAHARRGVQR